MSDQTYDIYPPKRDNENPRLRFIFREDPPPLRRS